MGKEREIKIEIPNTNLSIHGKLRGSLSKPLIILIGEKMYNEPKTIHWDKLMDDIHVPVKIVTAGKGGLIEHGRKYYRQAHQPKSYAKIQKATHSFDEDGAEEKLFEETVSWFKKFV